MQGNPANIYLQNPELENVHLEIQPTNNWNTESKFHWKRLESSTWNRESTAWDSESKASGFTDMRRIEKISREKKISLTPLVDHGV